MLQISLSAQNGIPLVDQIVTAVRGQIDDRVLRPGGRLADVAPTVLDLMGLDLPPEMTGKTLIERA